MRRHKKSNLEDFIKKAKQIHGDKYDYSKSEYLNNETKIIIICPKHGEFWQTPAHHLNGEGCPICKESKLENNVSKILSSLNIIFEREKRFSWLTDNKRLDFFIPEKNIGIECQGEQHYFPVDFWGKGNEYAENKFKRMIKLDEDKMKECKSNGIHLFYIKYNCNDILKEIKKIINYGL